MSVVTTLWTMEGAAALTLAAVHGLAWLLDRRNLPSLALCVVAISLACYPIFDLGLMNAQSATDYGQWLRWYYVPNFVFYLGCVLFVRSYLGTGRPWLAWTSVGGRFLVVVANLLISPNVTWRSISSLRQVPFLGDRISVVANGSLRPLHWLMSVPVFVLLSFVVGAAIESWRKGGTDSRFKALVVGLGVAGPVLGAWTMWQFGLLRWGDFPTLYTPLFSITLVVMTFELSRTAAISRRSQLQVAALEAELTWAGRVSALGQLASGLAHELCQPLSAILNNTEAAQLQLGGDKPDVEELRSILRDIRESDTRAVQIIHRMRALIKRHKLEVRALTLGDVIQEVILLARSEARAKCVSLECCIESSLPPVLGDRVQISQVLLNLVMNGIQATQSNAARPRTISIEARIDGEHVEVAVRDSGPGVPAERMKRVFEPFYSTKPEGMGMGLAICRTIIEAHNGRIWVEQSQGGGATFLFTIPQAPEPAISPDGWRPPVSATGAERHATI